MIDKEWQDGDDSALYAEGHDEGFALALGMVFDFVQSNGDINKTNAVEVMNLIAQRRGE